MKRYPGVKSVWFGSVALALGLAACGGPPEPAHFAGYVADEALSADEVREVSGRPAGYETLGTVSSSCTSVSFVRSIERAWLKDVLCSDALLVEALRFKAARVGGELLVGRRCSTESERDDGTERVERHCHASVARSDEDKGLEPVKIPRVASADLEPAEAELLQVLPAVEAWHVVVSFAPASDSNPVRAPMRPDRVGDLPVLPPSHVVLGDVVVKCKGTCAPEGLRLAVRATAGRIGADDVVGVACVQTHRGSMCTGRAAAYEVRPELLPE